MRRLITLLLFVPSAVLAKQTSQVTIRDTELHYIESKIIDEKLEVDVFLPRNYTSEEKRYPVVYITDAEYNFGDGRFPDSGQAESFIEFLISFPFKKDAIGKKSPFLSSIENENMLTVDGILAGRWHP